LGEERKMKVLSGGRIAERRERQKTSLSTQKRRRGGGGCESVKALEEREELTVSTFNQRERNPETAPPKDSRKREPIPNEEEARETLPSPGGSP